jgi:tetratricopeptide (TPR) repeat protein
MKRALVSLLFTLAIAPAAFSGGDVYAADAPVSADVEEKARQAFARGEKLYKSQKYAEAVTAFEEGYRIKPAPAFLFDLGMTYQAMGDSQKAIEKFRAYLKATPTAEDRAAVEAVIASEEKKLAQRATAPAAAAVATTTKTAAATTTAAAAATPAPATTASTTTASATASSTTTASAPIALLTASDKEPAAPKDKVEGAPFYKKWWFWTATGVVAASAVAIGLGAGLSQPGTEPFKEVTWR